MTTQKITDSPIDFAEKIIEDVKKLKRGWGA
jgi:hypothetical protein